MVKGCLLPALYWALIPMRDPKTDQNNVLTWMPFLLVHEMLSALWDALGEALYDPSPTIENNIRKEVSSDGGLVTVFYYNGDMKESHKTGLVRYLYSDTATWHTRYPDGREVTQFNNGQTEVSPDSSEEIYRYIG